MNCPKCGYCPTCGRSSFQYQQFPNVQATCGQTGNLNNAKLGSLTSQAQQGGQQQFPHPGAGPKPLGREEDDGN